MHYYIPKPWLPKIHFFGNNYRFQHQTESFFCCWVGHVLSFRRATVGIRENIRTLTWGFCNILSKKVTNARQMPAKCPPNARQMPAKCHGVGGACNRQNHDQKDRGHRLRLVSSRDIFSQHNTIPHPVMLVISSRPDSTK